MKATTLNLKIKELPTTGTACGFIRRLAGVDAQKYRDAHRCMNNAREDGLAQPDTKSAKAHISEQADAVKAFIAEYGEWTVKAFMDANGLTYKDRSVKRCRI